MLLQGVPVFLNRITSAQYDRYQEWMRQLGFGFEEVDDYNINDKDINASNWRKQAVCISTTVYFGAQTQRKV